MRGNYLAKRSKLLLRVHNMEPGMGFEPMYSESAARRLYHSATPANPKFREIWMLIKFAFHVKFFMTGWKQTFVAASCLIFGNLHI